MPRLTTFATTLRPVENPLAVQPETHQTQAPGVPDELVCECCGLREPHHRSGCLYAEETYA